MPVMPHLRELGTAFKRLPGLTHDLLDAECRQKIESFIGVTWRPAYFYVYDLKRN